jgi:LmbE family N-acetylglucosaminyl deacetylase/protein-L-isoaspartate O-methyltransferase
VVSFDAHAPGTPAVEWRDDPRWDAVAPLELSSVRRLIVVAAHPDDETLGCGGLIAECARRGVAVRVIVVTDGAASHPDSGTHDENRLRTIRERELSRAVRRLAPDAAIDWMGFADGATDRERERIAGRLGSQLLFLDRETLVVAPWTGDGHRDHRIVGEIVVEQLRSTSATLLAYPIWVWHWASPSHGSFPWERARALELPPEAATAKAEAIDEYASQVAPLSDRPGDERVLEAGVLEHFRGDREVYLDPTTGSGVAMPESYFEELYARNPDPWRFTTRWYERRKRALTLASLPREHYGAVLELGCSIGVLTRELAPLVDRMTAIDISATAVEIARERLADRPHVEVLQGDVTAELPPGPFDLIVVSEIGYYLDEAALRALLAALTSRLSDGGELVACHWRPRVADYLLAGDDVDRIARESSGLRVVTEYRDDDLLLTVLSSDPRSVGTRTGLR